MMKHKKLFITAMTITMLLSTGIPLEASANTGTVNTTVQAATPTHIGTVTATTLNVRTKPSPTATLFTRLSKGTKVEVYSSHTYGTTKWYKVKTTKGYGYVSGAYLKLTTYTTPKAIMPTHIGTVTATSLNVRSQTNTASTIIGKLSKGTKVEVYSKHMSGSTAWYKIKVGSKYGYVSGAYLTLKVYNPSPKPTPEPVVTPVPVPTPTPTPVPTPTPTPTPVPVTQGYQFNGKGFGHAIGMTQWGAKGMADEGFTSHQIVKYYYTGVEVEKRDLSSQDIRVALSVGQPTINVSSAGAYALVNSTTGATILTATPGVATTVTYASGTYSITHNGKVTKTTQPLTVKATGTAPLAHKGKTYRGVIHLSPSTTTTLDAVNQLNIELYLRAVVPGEMYVSWHNEALKAQTLAARTYAMKALRPTKKFDVYDDTRSQVYGGVGIENAKVTSLIEATKGEVITYNGTLIDALYSSSAGGHTIDSEDLYNYSPYLRGKPDPYDKSVYVTTGWTMSLTLDDLSKVFTEVGNVKEVKVLTVKYGRPTSIQVIGDKTSVTVTGNVFRSRVGSTKIKSTMFELKSY